jgi:hypothetical protein
MIPTYLMEVDHEDPVIPPDKTLEDMSWDEIIDRIWCDERNLRAICKECHRAKTKKETKLRKSYRSSKK